MLLPGQTDHNSQAVLVRQIEDPAGRNGVGAYGVRAAGRNVREVPSDALQVRVRMAICIGAEWSVGNATNVQLVLASKEELAADVDALRGQRRRHWAQVVTGSSVVHRLRHAHSGAWPHWVETTTRCG